MSILHRDPASYCLPLAMPLAMSGFHVSSAAPSSECGCCLDYPQFTVLQSHKTSSPPPPLTQVGDADAPLSHVARGGDLCGAPGVDTPRARAPIESHSAVRKGKHATRAVHGQGIA